MSTDAKPPAAKTTTAEPTAAKPFDNQLVVVTGAGSGIGRAVALGFAANGARVVAADIDLDAATSVCELIIKQGGKAHAWQVDVSAAGEMERFAAWVHGELGVPDVVVKQRGHRHHGLVPRPFRGGLAADRRGEPARRGSRLPPVRGADGAARGRRPPGQHRLGGLVRADRRAARLLGHQGRGADAQRVPCAPSWPAPASG